MKEKFAISGMTCSACSAGIERTVKKLNGVQAVDVSLMGECMNVEYDEKALERTRIFTAVTELGYGISEFDENALKARKPQSDTLKRRFLISIWFLIPLMYFSMGGMLGLPLPPHAVGNSVQMLLSLAIIFLNFKFFENGAKALWKRAPNMDTLVAMGVGVSFLYSFVFTILSFTGRHAGHLFFESAGMILTLVTLGKWLEEKSKRKTGDEIEKLISVMPNTVTIDRDGTKTTLAFSDIEVGDILIVKQGEYIPVDGVVTEGSGYIDRSAITGESMPVEVERGHNVTSADIVKSGFLKVRAEKVGIHTTLSQIVKMVKNAGASKAPIQKLADTIAGIFVPVVTLIALVTFMLWFILTGNLATSANYGICVLVISCPCSLGLATPVAVMTATGKGMSLGILYKDAETLQKAKDINCVLLDKTATLTLGQPKVTDFEILAGDPTRALQIAESIESRSNHPIADCIRAFALDKLNVNALEVQNYEYETGKGAFAEYNGEWYYIGNRKRVRGIEDKKAYEYEKKYSEQGKTAVFLADSKQIIAVFGVSDTLKADATEAVAQLKCRKIRVGMLTGDNENVAKVMAKQAGIDEYFAEALPKDKAEAVERVKQAGGIVAMVGDGINDAPALKVAHVGVAMGNGTDIAIDSADVVLSRGDVSLVSIMIDLSKATVKNIRQNLFWAFFYNCVAIPIAGGALSFAGVTLTPMIGALAMSLSSLFVVTNALRLRNFTSSVKEDGMKRTLKVEGMMCQRCVAHVTKALESVTGVVGVDVNLKKKTAVVLLAQTVSDEVLTQAVTDAGYEVKNIS